MSGNRRKCLWADVCQDCYECECLLCGYYYPSDEEQQAEFLAQQDLKFCQEWEDEEE